MHQGGNNIGEYPVRDLTEDHLLSWAEVNEVPVLGVCRGMQMIANWAGSGLVAVDGHTGSSHKLLISGGESGFPKVVNSFHDWAIVECPDKFKVLAHSEDGVIEAIRHQSLKWEGWMWHPERELHPHIKDTERLNRLFAVL